MSGSGMGAIVLDSAGVRAAGAGVSAVAGLLGREIAVMQQMLGEVQRGWQSDVAAPRFVAVMRAQLTDVTALKTALESHGTALSSSGVHIDRAEHDLGSAIPAV